MTKQQEAAIARVCAHECLQRELVEALESVVAAWDRVYSTLPLPLEFEDIEFSEMQRARAVLARAKEQLT